MNSRERLVHFSAESEYDLRVEVILYLFLLNVKYIKFKHCSLYM